MNKLIITKTVFVPRDENDPALVHYTKKVYDTSPNGFKLISDVKEETNKYILSKKELEKIISDAYWAGLNGSMNDYSDAKVIGSEIINIKAGGGAIQYVNTII